LRPRRTAAAGAARPEAQRAAGAAVRPRRPAVPGQRRPGAGQPRAGRARARAAPEVRRAHRQRGAGRAGPAARRVGRRPVDAVEHALSTLRPPMPEFTFRALAQGPLGFPMPDRAALEVDQVLRTLPKTKEYEYRHLVLTRGLSELNPGERSDVSWISTESVDR